MSWLDSETKRKLREMGVTVLLDAFEAQDDTLTLGMAFEERVQLVVDEAHAAFTHSKVEGLIRRAGLRYPDADLRRVDLIEQRGLDRGRLAQLGTCSFITRQQNVVFQGFTGSGKSYLGSALAKQACLHRSRGVLGSGERQARLNRKDTMSSLSKLIAILDDKVILVARQDPGTLDYSTSPQTAVLLWIPGT